jgi:hypothetical protein
VLPAEDGDPVGMELRSGTRAPGLLRACEGGQMVTVRWLMLTAPVVVMYTVWVPVGLGQQELVLRCQAPLPSG